MGRCSSTQPNGEQCTQSGSEDVVLVAPSVKTGDGWTVTYSEKDEKRGIEPEDCLAFVHASCACSAIIRLVCANGTACLSCCFHAHPCKTLAPLLMFLSAVPQRVRL